MNKINKIYKHIRTGRLYEKITEARSVDNVSIALENNYVVYRQLNDSILRGTSIILKKGSTWVREKSDFNEKFVPYQTNNTEILDKPLKHYSRTELDKILSKEEKEFAEKLDYFDIIKI